MNEGKIYAKLSEKDGSLSDVFKLKEALKKIYIKGIKGITQVLPVKREDEYVVEGVHKGLKSRFYKSGRFSPTKEKGVHHFQRLLLKFLKDNWGLDCNYQMALFSHLSLH